MSVSNQAYSEAVAEQSKLAADLAAVTATLEQAQLRNREQAGALACLESLATGEAPCYHDAEFLRAEMVRVIAECRANIARAKAEYLARAA